MTDFDPDAYLQETAHQGFDPDAYLNQAPVKMSSPVHVGSEGSTGEGGIGMAETALHLGSGYLGKLGGGLTYLGTLAATGGDTEAAKAVQEDTEKAITYQPRTEEGQTMTQGLGDLVAPVGRYVGKAVEALSNRAAEKHGPAAGAFEQTVLQGAPYVLGIGPTTRAAESAVGGLSRVGEAINRIGLEPPTSVPGSGMESSQSMGAAHAAPDLSNASPELQAAVTDAARRSGGAVNPQALTRQQEADSLPEPVRLTKGQALQDVQQLSREQNLRGQNPELAQRFNEQNGQLIRNLQAFRDQVGPDVFSTNPVQHGDTLIDAYEAKDAAARAQIDAAYTEARKSIAPRTPILDARDLLGRIKGVLEDKWATGPADIMGRLEKSVATGDATLNAKQFEGLRTRLAELSRDSDGSTRYAAHLIRGVVEDSDLMPGTEAFKEPFDRARALARQRFQTIEADPAYDAAINRTVPPDRFVQKFVTGGTRDGIAAMRSNLADDATAQQTMTVAGLDHLRRSAGIDDMGNGNFSQAGYNRAAQQLGPKRLFDPQTADSVERLGNVARYTQMQPRGSFVNNSNTFTAAAAEYGKSALEGMANVAAKGVPVGTFARKALQNRAQNKFVQDALKPGAGIDQLNETR